MEIQSFWWYQIQFMINKIILSLDNLYSFTYFDENKHNNL